MPAATPVTVCAIDDGRDVKFASTAPYTAKARRRNTNAAPIIGTKKGRSSPRPFVALAGSDLAAGTHEPEQEQEHVDEVEVQLERAEDRALDRHLPAAN